MLKYKNIIKDPNEILKQKAEKVDFPLDIETVKTIQKMREYLINSQKENINEKDYRPGIGLAAPQIGISKQMFVIYYEDENGNINDQVFINPKIIATSNQQIYLEKGEGCLSVEEEYQGIVLRNEQLEVEYFDANGQKHRDTIKDFLAIVFQHEYDHLQGILFYEKFAGVMQKDLIEKANKI